MRIAAPLVLVLLWAACSIPSSPPGVTVPDPRPGELDSLTLRMASLVRSLEGKWSDSSADSTTVFHEQWHRTADDLYTGLGFVLSGKDTAFIEHLTIRWDPTGGYYSALIPAQNAGEPVDFSLIHADADSMVFENALHDFPQRIAYALAPGGGWNVVVSGETPQGPRAERFTFKPALDAEGDPQ